MATVIEFYNLKRFPEPLTRTSVEHRAKVIEFQHKPTTIAVDAALTEPASETEPVSIENRPTEEVEKSR